MLILIIKMCLLRRHSHHNETGVPAWVLPMQDAGLYTYQRTLDIRFSLPPASKSEDDSKKVA
jgi:hypothetical protein